jgi:hypothetical protein
VLIKNGNNISPLLDYTKSGDFLMRYMWNVVIFLLGGVSYCLIEIMWRQHTHWTMLVLGGICFLALYKIFNKLNNISLLEKCVLGAGVITLFEFTTGCIVNLYFGLKIWNYSNMPFNLLGQISIVYSTLWGFLCIPINFLSKKIKENYNSTMAIKMEK